MKTKILNLLGGPGSRKSTMAADVYARLKWAGYNVELVREYAKDLVWEFGCIPDNITQEMILAEQYRRQQILIGKVDLMITDSPLILSTLYGTNIADATIRSGEFDNYNVFIERRAAYNPSGRYQDEAGARALDDRCRHMATKVLPGTVLGVQWLYEHSVDIIKNRVKESKPIEWNNPVEERVADMHTLRSTSHPNISVEWFDSLSNNFTVLVDGVQVLTENTLQGACDVVSGIGEAICSLD